MGGSFDPIHMGHLIIAEAAREALRLDTVLFVPAGQQPLKLGSRVTPAEDRAEMVRLAIEGNPNFALSLVDVGRAGPSYTVDTLRELKADAEGAREGDVAMWFVMGADSLLTFSRWRDPDGIISLSQLAVVRRPGFTVDLASLYSEWPALPVKVDWVDAPLIDISATALRERVRAGKSIRYRVPEAVRRYIEAEGLYMED